MAANRTLRIRIDGRVQGVGFRYWMEQMSTEVGLAGWVRNRRDGSVEAVISGDAALVEEMLARCRQGPSGARVRDVAVLAEEDGSYTGFDIKPTV